MLRFRKRVHRRLDLRPESAHLNCVLLRLLVSKLVPELVAEDVLKRDEIREHRTTELGAEAVAIVLPLWVLWRHSERHIARQVLLTGRGRIEVAVWRLEEQVADVLHRRVLRPA